jgi:hypothetical protein
MLVGDREMMIVAFEELEFVAVVETVGMRLEIRL